MSTATVTPDTATATAEDVRAFFQADSKRLKGLSPEAAATVAEGARGLLHPEVIKRHNQRRRTRVYVVGASKAATAKREADRAALREAGLLTPGARGPLSKAARDFLAEREQG